MGELNLEDIEGLLKADKIGRNTQLNSVIRFLNTISKDRPMAISLDGSWGSGKTVFVKQLEIVNQNGGESVYPNIDKQ